MNEHLQKTETTFMQKVVMWYLPVLIISAAIVFYYYLLLRYNVNVPRDDDYGIALRFLNKFTNEPSFGEKLKLLFSQHGEHRLLFPRLVVLADYFVLGKVNFVSLVIIGNLGMVAIAWVLYKSAPSDNYKLFLFIPVVLVIFQLQQWENATFPTASVQSFYVIFFSLLALYALGRQTLPYDIIACAAIFFAMFTSGSGSMCFLPGVLILVIQKRYTILAVWAGVFLCSLFLYFFHYSNESASRIFDLIFERPVQIALTFFAAVGSFINFSKGWEPAGWGYPASLVCGVAVVASFLYFTYRKYFLQSPVLYSFLLLFLLTCGTLAISRTHAYTPSEISAVSRYKIISTCIIAITYLIYIDIAGKRLRIAMASLCIVAGLIYGYQAYVKNIETIKINIEALIETSWAIYQDNDYSKVRDWDPAMSAIDLKESQSAGIYLIPDLSDEYLRRSATSKELIDLAWDNILRADSTVIYDFKVRTTEEGNFFAVRKGWALRLGVNPRKHVLAFKSSGKSFFFGAFTNYRPDITETMHVKNPEDKAGYDDSGFNIGVTASDIDPGDYEVGVVLQNWDGTNYYIPANLTAKIK